MATNLKLPDTLTFTRAELAERWNCDISRIDRYISDGLLKEGFNVYGAGYEYLRELKYFVSKTNDDEEQLKKILDTKKKWSEIENSNLSEKFINVPIFLYLWFGDVRKFEAREKDKPSFFESIRKKFFSEDEDDIVDFFCDLEWNPLTMIAVIDDRCVMGSVKKPKLEDMIIPLEEVLRFEKKYRVREKDEDVRSAIGRQGRIAKKEQEDSKSATLKTTDSVTGNRPPPPRKPPLAKKEVAARIGISVSHLENLRKQVDFPKSFPIIPGGRAIGWDEDEIDQWIKKEQRGKSADETESNE